MNSGNALYRRTPCSGTLRGCEVISYGFSGVNLRDAGIAEPRTAWRPIGGAVGGMPGGHRWKAVESGYCHGLSGMLTRQEPGDAAVQQHKKL